MDCPASEDLKKHRIVIVNNPYWSDYANYADNRVKTTKYSMYFK